MEIYFVCFRPVKQESKERVVTWMPLELTIFHRLIPSFSFLNMRLLLDLLVLLVTPEATIRGDNKIGCDCCLVNLIGIVVMILGSLDAIFAQHLPIKIAIVSEA